MRSDVISRAGRERRLTGSPLVKNEQGHLIIMVLVVMMISIIAGLAFTSLISNRQRLAGLRYRAMAARYLAEAGVEWALWTLEAGLRGPDDLRGASDAFAAGGREARFTIEEVQEEQDGLLSLISRGEFAGTRRDVKVVVRLAPRILTYALFGDRMIRFEGSESRTYIVAVGAAICGEGASLGSNGEIWFATFGASVAAFANTPGIQQIGRGQPDELARWLEASASSHEREARPGRVSLTGGAFISFGGVHQPILDASVLRGLGVDFYGEIVAIREHEELLVIDRAALRALAAGNSANAALNAAAGLHSGRPFEAKDDSVYTGQQFKDLLNHLIESRTETLKGPIYVTEPVKIPKESRVTLRDGFLVVEGSLTLEPDAGLEVLHSPGSHLLPGIITVGHDAPLVVQQRGVLIVDGLVFAEHVFDAGEGSIVDIQGALIGGDPKLSVRNHNATLIVRYDSSVLSTTGVRPTQKSQTLAKVVSWEELRP